MRKLPFLAIAVVLASVPPSFAASATDTLEIHRLYKKAKEALDSGHFKDAKSAFETLGKKYRSSVAYESDEDGKVTFGQFVPKELEKIECFLNSETGDNNPARTNDDALKQLITAIAARDKSKLNSLVSCDVEEGVPFSEFDTTLRDKAVRHLLGNDEKDGYGYIRTSSPYKYVGKQLGYQVFSNGTDFVGFVFATSKHAPKTTRIHEILWGKPEQ